MACFCDNRADRMVSNDNFGGLSAIDNVTGLREVNDVNSGQFMHPGVTYRFTIWSESRSSLSRACWRARRA
ncbi:hypothetical protein Poly30_19550 [Planctomycetes bacterium Poly30]|uniref:Uncharacterized protein n=1 Tax=Saltatorellus ferox TaxID=2528018 RepID=A0A518EQS2_9BACT|nr:hypothetical protein Poly30_19550 [Planctomycetes bacterium Poly30]